MRSRNAVDEILSDPVCWVWIVLIIVILVHG